MGRVKTKFVCQECGHETPRWMGKCPGCGQWNTMVEEVEEKESVGWAVGRKAESLVKLDDIIITGEQRYSTGFAELDRVLGGGVVPGSLILLGGDPGIGKSTLLLQVANYVSHKTGKVLYVTGEESIKQIKMRSTRLRIASDNLYIAAETNMEMVEEYIKKANPVLVIVDSIQTVFSSRLSSAPGSVSQVRESTGYLLKISKRKGCSIFIVGHVTKQGFVAGPRMLEHMVDCVLYLEGEKHYTYRVLRAVKNRYGSTNEIGIFEMKANGLQEIENPSEILLSGKPQNVPGSVVISSIEGTRPILVEVQALLSPTMFGTPRRMATGIDYNRVVLLMAVMEKRLGLGLVGMDAYVNVTGGIRIDEPAVDLGVACAIASSFKDVPVDGKTVVFGEVGLSGEIRAVNNGEKRIKEALKMGFERCVVPADNCKNLNDTKGIELIGVNNLAQALEILL